VVHSSNLGPELLLVTKRLGDSLVELGDERRLLAAKQVASELAELGNVLWGAFDAGRDHVVEAEFPRVVGSLGLGLGLVRLGLVGPVDGLGEGLSELRGREHLHELTARLRGAIRGRSTGGVGGGSVTSGPEERVVPHAVRGDLGLQELVHEGPE